MAVAQGSMTDAKQASKNGMPLSPGPGASSTKHPKRASKKGGRHSSRKY